MPIVKIPRKSSRINQLAQYVGMAFLKDRCTLRPVVHKSSVASVYKIAYGLVPLGLAITARIALFE